MNRFQAFTILYTLFTLNALAHGEGEALSSESIAAPYEGEGNLNQDPGETSQKFYDNFWDPR
jgi:hypothetical protein